MRKKPQPVYDGTAPGVETRSMGPGIPGHVQNAADAAWENYRNCYSMGGTPEQKRWAYDRARAAEEKVWAAERAAAAELKRAQKKAQAKALRG